MKMNKKDSKRLYAILEDMEKTQEYLLKPTVHVGVENKCPNGLSYTNRDGISIDSINKYVGSNLCYLYNAINRLKGLLEEVTP